MQDDQWLDVVGRIRDSFTLHEEYEEGLESGPGKVQVVIFDGPLGRMKLERTTRPVLLGTKGLGSNRIGGEARVTHQYSLDESTSVVHAYKWENDDWIRVEGDAFGQ